MPEDSKKQDIRIIKTKRALQDSLLKLLKQRSFIRITVNDLCEDAQVSRATFYTHFIDKYDLLQYCLNDMQKLFRADRPYEEKKERLNHFIFEHSTRIKHLLEDKDTETLRLVFEFILSFSCLNFAERQIEQTSLQYVVITNMFAGGVISYLYWLINAKFSAPWLPFNNYLYRIVSMLREIALEDDGGELE